MRPALAALLVSAAFSLCVHAADLRNFDDAALRAVQFVDRNEGWAVGDDGGVWHSIDGGNSWERQPTGVRASLRSLHFLNPYTGWVVGREELPHGGGSVGVLLFTDDGGLKWRKSADNTLPGLNRVQFLDERIGFVVGDGTDSFPSGVFKTTDGGRTWQPVPGPRVPTWLAADFQNEKTGALVGAWNRVATLREGVLGMADMHALGGRGIRAIQVVGARAVAVGDGGLILQSRDTAGVRWAIADLPFATEVKNSCDFHAVHCVGEQIWVVGRPGSLLLHSADKGESWTARKTGQPLPLHGVFFLNDGLHGWAVGELGTVIATTDGGKTWRIQRRGGARTAALFVHAHVADIPLDTVAKLGGDEGYLTAAIRVVGPEVVSAAPRHATEAERLALAMRRAGGAAGECLWPFPLAQHSREANEKVVLQAWERLHSDRAKEEFLRHMVLALRIWRPAVVLTDNSNGCGAERLLLDTLKLAFQQASDPKKFPEQIDELGLEPWEAQKLYGRCAKGTGPMVMLDLNEISPRLEASLRDFAGTAFAVLTDASQVVPAQRNYWLHASRMSGADGHQSLMQGITLPPGGSARRPAVAAKEIDADLAKSIRTRRNLQALAETESNQLTDPNRLLAQVVPALKNMPEHQGAPAAFAVGSQYARMGQWPLAREVFLAMVDRYPAHPLSADAYRWLIRHNTSSEARRRHEQGQFLLVTQTAPRPIEAVGLKPGTTVNSGAEQAQYQQLTLLGDLREVRDWYQGGVKIGERLSALGPVYATEPSIQFCLQSARRQLGEVEAVQKWFERFRGQNAPERSADPWRLAAAAEVWLTNRSEQPPRPVALCRQTMAKPYLDGKLDDECWQGVKPLIFHNASGDTRKEYPTEAFFTFDKDFLYLGLRCRHPADRHVPLAEERKRDADLRGHDRVSLLLDLDRDYSTYFHLQMDQRGCLADDCWGDVSWNPRWFVAVHSEKEAWHLEAAIPLTELTGEPITVGRAWACNVVRVVPGRGVQAFALPADVQPRPEGMGLLLFTAEPKKRDKVTR